MSLQLAQRTASRTSTLTSPKLGLLQRKCDCGAHTPSGGSCARCTVGRTGIQRQLAIGSANDPLEHEAESVAKRVVAGSQSPGGNGAPLAIQRALSTTSGENDAVPESVDRVLASPGRLLDTTVRQDMEQRFARDFSHIRVHHGTGAERSAQDVNARAYTSGNQIVFGAGAYEPSTPDGRRLIAHELTHTIQQSGGMHGEPVQHSAGAPSATLQRQALDEAEGAGTAGDAGLGFEIDPGELMVLPRATLLPVPDEAALQPVAGPSLPANMCDTPDGMHKVISGPFVGGKTLDDYYPDLVGRGFWGSSNTAGPFDNGSRAGSSVQLYGTLPIPCATSVLPTTLGQTATIVRARANGSRMTEGGRALEGQTINDIARSGRDSSRAPFRQTWVGAISMADPISGIPYAPLTSYEWEVNLTSSLTGAGGTVSVNWGVTVEAAAGRVTRNEVR